MPSEMEKAISSEMAAKDTKELLAIWVENNRDYWSDEAIDAAGAVLAERGVATPPQKAHDPGSGFREAGWVESEPARQSMLQWISRCAAIASLLLLMLCYWFSGQAGLTTTTWWADAIFVAIFLNIAVWARFRFWIFVLLIPVGGWSAMRIIGGSVLSLQQLSESATPLQSLFWIAQPVVVLLWLVAFYGYWQRRGNVRRQAAWVRGPHDTL